MTTTSADIACVTYRRSTSLTAVPARLPPLHTASAPGDLVCSLNVTSVGNFGAQVADLTLSPGTQFGMTQQGAAVVQKNSVLEPADRVSMPLVRSITQDDFDTNTTIVMFAETAAKARVTQREFKASAEKVVELTLTPSLTARLNANTTDVSRIGEWGQDG